MTPIRVELLGRLRFIYGDEEIASVNTNRLQSLLAFIVLHSEGEQSRERIASLLWPESSDTQARTNLRQLLHNLRRALPSECSLLVSDNQTIRWLPDKHCTVDVVEFEALIRLADLSSSGDMNAAHQALDEAARIYQDDLLPHLYDEWIRPKREQLRSQLASVVTRLATILEASGNYPEGIRHATRLITLDPLREAYHEILIRMHMRNQDRSSALRVYHQCKRTLLRELGVSPSKPIQQLLVEILKSEGSSSTPAAVPRFGVTKALPIVGRKAEWEQLQGFWRRVSNGESRCVLIKGEPGVGKSRFAEELFQSCSRRPEAAVARARCYFARGQLAYAPVAEWLREEPLRLSRARLSKPQLAELARVLPELLTDRPEIVPPQPFTESWQRLHFYEALHAAIRNATKPLLLLIDDLQWCDQDTYEWLHFLFRYGGSERFLVLGTVRMEETGRNHPLASLRHELSQTGQLSEIAMMPLSETETADLAAQVSTERCDSTFLSGLYRTTGGNALFVVESVRAALEGQTSDVLVSPKVQAVIAARLAQLSPPAYELAGFGAAIGRPFSFDLLSRSTDWDEKSLLNALEELWQRRIVDGRGEDGFGYTHELLREVAYSELSPIRRRSLHRRIARALEELHAPALEAVSGWLAAHYYEANMGREAIRYYRMAASVARQRFSDAESADFIRRAIGICRDSPESNERDREELELLVTLGPSLATTEGYSMPEVGETYARGLLLSKRAGDEEHLFSLLSGAWLFHIVRGDLEESRRLAQDSVDAAIRQEALAQQMASRFLLGTSLFHLGRLDASWDQIERAVPILDGPSHPALVLFAGPHLGVFRRAYQSHLLCQFGDVDQAVAKSEESISWAREVSHPFTLGIALDYAAMLNVYRGERGLALARAEAASEICRKHGFGYYLAVADVLAGWATGMDGDHAAGLARIVSGLGALKGMRAEIRLPFYYALMAEVCGLAGQTREALANIATGLAFLNKNGELWSAPELHRIHGDLLRNTGDSSRARINYQRAIDLAKQTGSRLSELRAASRLNELIRNG